MSAHPRLSLNQATVKYAPLATALSAALIAGIPSVGLWRESVAEVGLDAARQLVRQSGLRVSSLCRGGFFTTGDPTGKREAFEHNRTAIEETALLAEAGAAGSRPVLVLVAGGLPADSKDLRGARLRVADALAELAPVAAHHGVTLAIEALHPMYAADRAVVSTLGQALDLAEPFPPDQVGVVVDTFHIWWDPDVLTQITRAGAGGRIASYQVCDWLSPIAPDPLLSRGVMGDGVIDFQPITRAVVETGYRGDIEVEIFNQAVWDAPADQVAARVSAAFDRIIGPLLPIAAPSPVSVGESSPA